MENKRAKIRYQFYLNKEITDRTWYRHKALMKQARLELTDQNFKLMSYLYHQAECLNVSFERVINHYIKAIEDLDKTTLASGQAVVYQLTQITQFKAGQSTIMRWFKKHANGYSKDKFYRPEELIFVYLAAYLYQLRYATKKLGA
jgi:hypothetical protein